MIGRGRAPPPPPSIQSRKITKTCTTTNTPAPPKCPRPQAAPTPPPPPNTHTQPTPRTDLHAQNPARHRQHVRQHLQRVDRRGDVGVEKVGVPHEGGVGEGAGRDGPGGDGSQGGEWGCVLCVLRGLCVGRAEGVWRMGGGLGEVCVAGERRPAPQVCYVYTQYTCTHQWRWRRWGSSQRGRP